jgi:fructosamine-3-kinase
LLTLWRDIGDAIGEATGRPYRVAQHDGIGGGCINSAFRVTDGTQSWFVKTNRADLRPMFVAEAEGLNALADTGTIGVPRALCTGSSGDRSFIVMRHVELGRGSGDGWREAGLQLAALHRTVAQRHGWHLDNTIGSTPQPNTWHDDWIGFWRDQRLGFQLQEAARNGYAGRLQVLGDQLLDRFDVLIDHAPSPSLLHGDLWSGNLAFDADGAPVIFDPATYYGDREADLAMTELFGGFGQEFYAAYREAWPLDSGYPVRRTLYNLYHVLNHLNLFGGGYAGQAQRMMEQLLAEC